MFEVVDPRRRATNYSASPWSKRCSRERSKFWSTSWSAMVHRWFNSGPRWTIYSPRL